MNDRHADGHTPGPWHWEPGQGGIYKSWNGKQWLAATVEGTQLGWHEDHACAARERGANARLIAAAPNMLAALREAREIVEYNRYLRYELGWGYLDEDTCLATIDAAIQQSTGGSDE